MEKGDIPVIKPRYTPAKRTQSTTTAGRQFTDRVDFITAFKTALSTPRPPHRVLVYYGIGGIGKTTLRKELALRFAAAHPEGLFCTLDFVMPPLRGPEAALAALVSGVIHDEEGKRRKHGPSFPAFELAYITYLQKVEPHKSVRELRSVPLFDEDSIVFETAAMLWDFASTSVSVIKLLNRVRKELSDHLTREQDEALQDLSFREPNEILQALPHFFAADLRRWIEGQKGKGGPVVICLDTYEALWEKRSPGTQFLVDEWVRELVANLPEVLWVICGRERLRWAEREPEWTEALDQHLIGHMSDEDVVSFLNACGVAEPAVQERVIKASEGVPLYLDLAVDTYKEIERERQPRPEDFTPVQAKVMDRFLRYLTDAETVTLQTLSVSRWWDEDLFDHLVREFQTGYPVGAFAELMRFSFIGSGEAAGYTMHRLMRENLLGTAAPHLIKKVHRSIARHFAERNRALATPADGLRQEEIYHLVHADEPAGVALFKETAEQHVRLGHANRLRLLVEDAERYALTSPQSRLWVQYYRARLTYLEAAKAEAVKAYATIRNNPEAGVELKAYASCDLADYWVRSRLREPGAREEIQALLDEIEAMPVRDSKTASVWDCRQRIHSFDLNWDGVAECTAKLLDLYREYRDPLGVAQSIVLLKGRLFLMGDWPQYFAFSQRAPHLLAELGDAVAAAYAPLLRHRGVLWAGRYAEAEPFLRAVLADVREYEDKDHLARALLDVGYLLGLQRKFHEAEAHFAELLDLHQARGNTTGRATVLGWLGRLKGMAGDLETGVAYLRQRVEGDLAQGNPNGTSEALVWFGEVLERQARRYGAETPEGARALREAGQTYTLSLSKFASRRHYDCGALVGLMRVHFAQAEWEKAEAYAAEAEQVARPFEYNEYLAAIALTRGHMAWNRGEEVAAGRSYRQALVHALRFNRFALDELLGVNDWETPLVPLVPFCLAKGEQGRAFLQELLGWWQTGVNRLALEPALTISPVGAGTSLVAAEQLARRLEPGDGGAQLTVVEQLRTALR